MHDADGVVFSVDEVDAAVPADRDALRAVEGGGEGGTTVTREALFPGAGDVMDFSRGEIEAEDLVALARREPEIAARIEVERARAAQRRAGDGRAVGRVAGLAGAGEGRDHASLHVDFADDVVADVADVEVALGVELDAVWLRELGLGGGAAIAGVAGLAGAGDGGDDLGLRVHAAHGVIRHVDDEEVSLAIETELMGEVEGRSEGGAAVARVTLGTGARDGRDGAVGCDAAHALAAVFAKPQRAVGPADDAEGIVELRGGGGAAVAGETADAGAGDGAEGGGGGDGGGPDEQR